MGKILWRILFCHTNPAIWAELCFQLRGHSFYLEQECFPAYGCFCLKEPYRPNGNHPHNNMKKTWQYHGPKTRKSLQRNQTFCFLSCHEQFLYSRSKSKIRQKTKILYNFFHLSCFV